MKTVKDLIEYLQTKDQNLPLQQVYDGMETGFYVFEYKGKLCFSEAQHDPEYKDTDIEFMSFID